jgi:tetratricopeptide (TPR) repeat protein
MEEHAALLEKAIDLGSRRRYREAADTLLKLLRETEEYEEAYLYLGRSYHALGEYARAVEMLRHFLDLRPSSAAGYFFAGRSYLAAGRPRTAAVYLEHSLQLRPGFVSALQLLGYAHLKSKRLRQAVDVLSRAVELDYSNKSLFTGYLNALFVYALDRFRRGEFEEAEQLFRYLRNKGHDHILVHIHLGMIYRMQGETEEAVEAYERALSMSPDDEMLRFRLAVLLLEANRSREAFEHLNQITSIPEAQQLARMEADRFLAEQFYQQYNYTQALHHALQSIKRHPKDIYMRLLAGECYRELEEFEFAANHFRRVLDIDRRHLGAHIGITQVLWQRQEFAELRNRLRRIERLDPGNETAYYYGLLCEWKLESEPEQLAEQLHEGLNYLGDDPYLLLAQGDTFLRLEDYEEALRSFLRAVRTTPDFSLPYTRLIELHRQGVRVDGIDTIFDSYLNLEPQDRNIRGAYIHWLYREERFRDALEHIEQLLPDTDHLHYYNRLRAVCYRKLGDYASASVLYWRMLAAEPHKQEYLRALSYCLNREGKRKTAISLLERALDYLQNPDAELYLIYGVMLFREKSYEGALEAFREAATLRPNDWRPHYNIGEIYRRRGMKDFARRFLQRAEQLRESREQASDQRG